MSIQYGGLPITDIKYCDPQGTLKDVSSVVRNGTSVWNTYPRTDNQGVWSGSYKGVSATLTYRSSSGYFRGTVGSYILTLRYLSSYGSWRFENITSIESFSISGNEYSQLLRFPYAILTWSAT